VCVRSGHKVSKSNSLAGIALCFYASFDDARVVMSSTTARQVDQILWRELSMMKARGGRCIACKAEDPGARRIPAPCPHSALIDGELKGLAKSGLKSGFREIVGFTAKEAEAVAGISGANLLYLPDEASGIPQIIFDAIEGNRAGGAHPSESAESPARPDAGKEVEMSDRYEKAQTAVEITAKLGYNMTGFYDLLADARAIAQDIEALRARSRS
jgi:hypothetical protein